MSCRLVETSRRVDGRIPGIGDVEQGLNSENEDEMSYDIQVAVATHKPYRMPSDSCYLPLHVGAELHPDVCTDMQQDNEGENISASNASYSELAGLYWLWKNSYAAYKGLVHYRRHFRTSDSIKKSSEDRFCRIATGEDFASLFEKTGAQIILPKARNYVIETIDGHYRHTLPGEQLDAARSAIEGACPEYLSAFDAEMAGTKAHMFNMLVAKSDVFDAYCEWLFPLLGNVERCLGAKNYDAFNARWPGRISEMLLDTWLVTNDVMWAEMSTVSPEPVDWIAKGKGFLAAKFLGKKYGKSF